MKAEHKHKAQTVYFDAFEHDFLDDPLIALTSAISERIEQEPESRSATAWRLAKNAAPFLGKAVLRLGTAALVGKAISLTGEEDGALNDIGDNMAQEGGEISKSLAQFWKREDGKRAAMLQFRTALIALTEPVTAEEAEQDADLTEGAPKHKLVIVIDELDRCRPDYALSLLEIIKHFFNVDGVHFVLGVNLGELENSVKARYGSEINASKYLQKFVSLTMPLRGGTPRNSNFSDYVKHFENTAESLGATHTWQYGFLGEYLRMVDHHIGVSLRDVERILTLSLVAPTPRTSNNPSLEVFAGLAIIKVLRPQWIELARFEGLSFEQASTLFNFPSSDPFSTGMSNTKIIWRSSLKYDPSWTTPTDYTERLEGFFGKKQPRDNLRDIIANSFDSFIIPD